MPLTLIAVPLRVACAMAFFHVLAAAFAIGTTSVGHGRAHADLVVWTSGTEAAPPGRTGFALGPAMSVNQIAIITVPPSLGLLVDVTGSFTPAWVLLCLLTVVALALTADAEHRTR
jgi:hypothetical protein